MTDYTTNLDIALLDSNAVSPEDVVDDGFEAFDAKITGNVPCSFAANTLVLTQDEQAGGSIFTCVPGSPGPTGDCTLTFATFGIGIFAVINDTGFPLSLEYSGQALPAPVLDDGGCGIFCGDGSNIRTVVAGGSGGGGIVVAIQSSENMAAGAMANLWDSSGSPRMQNANATDGTKPCHGFSMTAVSSGEVGVFYGSGQINNRLSGLTPGTLYYLDIVAGGINSVAPSGSGNLVELVGVAISATSLAFSPALPGILLP